MDIHRETYSYARAESTEVRYQRSSPGRLSRRVAAIRTPGLIQLNRLLRSSSSTLLESSRLLLADCLHAHEMATYPPLPIIFPRRMCRLRRAGLWLLERFDVCTSAASGYTRMNRLRSRYSLYVASRIICPLARVSLMSQFCFCWGALDESFCRT